jgi:hypothetical protein
MTNTITMDNILSGLFAVVLIIIGVLNIVLVHPVPGVVYLLLSVLYLPGVNTFLKRRFGFSIHPLVKIVLGIVILLFTLGVSDLGKMIDAL